MFLREQLYMPQPLLTLEEAAQRLRTSIWTVRRWIREGKLVGTKIGGEWRVDPADLEEFIHKGRRPKRKDEGQQP